MDEWVEADGQTFKVEQPNPEGRRRAVVEAFKATEAEIARLHIPRLSAPVLVARRDVDLNYG